MVSTTPSLADPPTTKQLPDPPTSNGSKVTTDRPMEVPMLLSELYIGGSILLTISVVFIVINAFLIWLIFKNWTTVKRSKFFNSFFLGLVLSLADFMFALLVGFPASLHLTWMTYFRELASMRFYSMYIGHFVFEYIFLFRVLVVALLSTDSFLHLQFPLRYNADYESRKKVYLACGVAAALPLIFRTVPSLVLLLNYSRKESMHCMVYKDPSATAFEKHANIDRFYTPLTCAIFLKAGLNDVVRADVIILATITILSWVIIATTNLASLVTAFRRIRNSTCTGSAGISLRQIVKASLLICSITFSFMLTNFPYVCIWWMDYLYNAGEVSAKDSHIPEQRIFYLTLLVFISLVFHPWFFVLRLKSYRDLLKLLKRKLVSNLRSSQNLTLSSPATSKRMRLEDSIEMKRTSRVHRNDSVFSGKECSEIGQTSILAQVSGVSELGSPEVKNATKHLSVPET